MLGGSDNSSPSDLSFLSYPPKFQPVALKTTVPTARAKLHQSQEHVHFFTLLYPQYPEHIDFINERPSNESMILQALSSHQLKGQIKRFKGTAGSRV